MMGSSCHGRLTRSRISLLLETELVDEEDEEDEDEEALEMLRAREWV